MDSHSRPFSFSVCIFSLLPLPLLARARSPCPCPRHLSHSPSPPSLSGLHHEQREEVGPQGDGAGVAQGTEAEKEADARGGATREVRGTERGAGGGPQRVHVQYNHYEVPVCLYEVSVRSGTERGMGVPSACVYSTIMLVVHVCLNASLMSYCSSLLAM